MNQSNNSTLLSAKPNQRKWFCAPCNRHFTSGCALANHAAFFHSQKPSRCKICKRKFKNKIGLSVHTKKAHCKSIKKWKDHENKYSCEFCDFKTAYLRSLHSHRHLHTGRKPFQCKLCPHRSAKRSNLNAHIKMVHEKKVYACMLGGCLQTFKKKYLFDQHMNLHSGRTPYKCRRGCDKSFALSKDRVRHEGDKHGWKCNLCEMMFDTVKERILHKKLQHSATSMRLPFECANCKECFAIQSEFDQHFKNCCDVLSK